MPPDNTPAGGVRWEDITAFQRDVMIAAAAIDEAHPSGIQIKTCLDETYGEEIVHSRLYQALDALVELGLLEKGRGTIDARRNYYALTGDARRLIEAHARRCAGVLGFSIERPESLNT